MGLVFLMSEVPDSPRHMKAPSKAEVYRGTSPVKTPPGTLQYGYA